MPPVKDRILVNISLGFFSASCLLFLWVLYDGFQGRLQKNSDTPQRNSPSGDEVVQRARTLDPGTKVQSGPGFNFLSSQQTALFHLGGDTLQILGMSRDKKSGEPMVWIRHIESQTVGRFVAGQKLFEGPVILVAVRPEEIKVRYKGQLQAIPVRPETL